MNIKSLEEEVMKNSLLLEKEWKSILKDKEYKDMYVVFHDKKKVFTLIFEDAIKKGIKVFGNDVGFVVKKVTNESVTFSNLVGLTHYV